ncbi:hypothetical protein AJ78_04743 [Emergomyces pasteurianus Ep9510]|uniref:6-phosphogluconate dehydrogenase NADP-binding domain-containing protein n=1 Tax=Emergomyces pasteurianus Ep9510 TaxID=1447872 RepID=A0A1J9PEL9_9EURO|nr:hypothetical protein AJ78_04743 [Emergomyces pasteurianus Ep9510]
MRTLHYYQNNQPFLPLNLSNILASLVLAAWAQWCPSGSQSLASTYHFGDVKNSNVDEAISMSRNEKKMKRKISGCYDMHKFAESVKHAVVEGSGNDLRKGDIMFDGGNENYRKTERRRRELEPKGISWVGMGLTGGYPSARHGPSVALG